MVGCKYAFTKKSPFLLFSTLPWDLDQKSRERRERGLKSSISISPFPYYCTTVQYYRCIRDGPRNKSLWLRYGKERERQKSYFCTYSRKAKFKKQKCPLISATAVCVWYACVPRLTRHFMMDDGKKKAKYFPYKEK